MTNKNSSNFIAHYILEMYLWVSAISAGGKTLKKRSRRNRRPIIKDSELYIHSAHFMINLRSFKWCYFEETVIPCNFELSFGIVFVRL